MLETTTKTVSFTYDADTDRYFATFFKGEQILERKTLTNIEVDGLEEIVDFSAVPITMSGAELAEELDTLYFDNHGEETNFEALCRVLLG